MNTCALIKQMDEPHMLFNGAQSTVNSVLCIQARLKTVQTPGEDGASCSWALCSHLSLPELFAIFIFVSGFSCGKRWKSRISRPTYVTEQLFLVLSPHCVCQRIQWSQLIAKIMMYENFDSAMLYLCRELTHDNVQPNTFGLFSACYSTLVAYPLWNILCKTFCGVNTRSDYYLCYCCHQFIILLLVKTFQKSIVY
jgi:hypothetical protein